MTCEDLRSEYRWSMALAPKGPPAAVCAAGQAVGTWRHGSFETFAFVPSWLGPSWRLGFACEHGRVGGGPLAHWVDVVNLEPRSLWRFALHVGGDCLLDMESVHDGPCGYVAAGEMLHSIARMDGRRGLSVRIPGVGAEPARVEVDLWCVGMHPACGVMLHSH